MKIADEIAGALYDGTFHGDIPTIGDREEEVAYCAPIIAAKLRLIRDALHMVWDNPESMTPSDMLAQYTEACDMLEEEAR